MVKNVMLAAGVISLIMLGNIPSPAQGSGSKSTSIEAADSLFLSGQWDKARAGYEANVNQHPETIKALTWNRLGYCYQNLGNYQAALKNYRKAIEAKPSLLLKPYLTSRIARSYALLDDRDKALAWLDSAVLSGYSNLNELDTLPDYNSIRNDERFKAHRKTVYAIAYPCSANPKNRTFDFWIGEWDVYQTGTTSPKIGHSLVQSGAGGCLILENWTALVGTHEGKSINYYDPSSGHWQQDWIGSDGSPVHFLNGEYKDGAMRFTFDSVQPDKTKWPGRFFFYNPGPDRVRQFSEHSADGGKTWQSNYDYTYIRKKK